MRCVAGGGTDRRQNVSETDGIWAKTSGRLTFALGYAPELGVWGVALAWGPGEGGWKGLGRDVSLLGDTRHAERQRG